MFLLQSHPDFLLLHSFPTRRSSDLDLADDLKFPIRPADFTRGQFKGGSTVRDIFRTMTLGLDGSPMPSRPRRSEEHTSELQSPYDLVCRLLLEKKKQTITSVPAH